MQLDERMRKFPIKFYQKLDGTIHYENKFLSGDSKSLDDAFKVFTGNDWDWDLVYYYDDITDAEFGAFEPGDGRLINGMKYLGQLNLDIEINTGWGTGEHSVTYLSKHPEAHKDQIEFIKKLKKEAEVDDLKNKLKQGFKKLAGMFQHEMFDPIKTRQDLICEHCGEIIPVGTYYEEYNGNYHLECIWDKLCNNKKSNTYDNAKAFFISLHRYVGNWPNTGLDIQDDYLFDLELVKVNNRKHLTDFVLNHIK